MFGVLLGYGTLHVILRTLMSSSVDLDESEQVVLAQKLCWGYGSAPPLYTWLQVLFFRVMGESVLALSVLKHLLLLGTCWLTYQTARVMTRNAAAGVAAALSLFFLPSVAWESHRDLTHSVLAATLASATLLCLLHVLERQTASRYALLGLVCGLGAISKYNYAFWLLGLLVAAMSLPECRSSVLNRRMLAALGICAAVSLPNLLWALGHRDLALLDSTKFNIKPDSNWWEAVREGVRNMAQSLFSFGAPLGLVYAVVFLKAPDRGGQEGADDRVRKWRRLILRAWVSILVLLLLAVCVSRATGFKERWFQPVLISAPVLAVLLIHRRLDRIRLKVLAGFGLAVMAAVAVILPGRLLVAERLKREEPLTRPYAELAAQLRDVVPPGSMVVCDTQLLAGNMRLGLDARILPPELTSVLVENRQHCFLLWSANRSESLPAELAEWARVHGARRSNAPVVAEAGGSGAERRAPALREPACSSAQRASAESSGGGPARYFTATYKFHKSKQYRLGLVQVY